MGQAKLAVSRAGGVLLVQVTGLLGRASCSSLINLVNTSLQQRPSVKALVDMRRAVSLLGPRDLAEIAESALKGRRLNVATGFLVDPTFRTASQQHCMKMASGGHLRVTFTELSAALQWVELPVPQLRELREFLPLQAL
jgi:hypothetical protein